MEKHIEHLKAFIESYTEEYANSIEKWGSNDKLTFVYYSSLSAFFNALQDALKCRD